MVTTIAAEKFTQEVSERLGESRDAAEADKPQFQQESPVSPQTQTAVPPAVIPPPNAIRAMDKGRFASGLLLSSVGIACLLMIALGALQQANIAARFSMPIVACAAIMGIMMLGGGFGLMATAAAGFDDGEFDRLMEAGNISAAETSERFRRRADDSMSAPEPAHDRVRNVEPLNSTDDVGAGDVETQDVA
jgi:hypothetical protein